LKTARRAAFPADLALTVKEVIRRDGRIVPSDLAPFTACQGEITAALGTGQGLENPLVALARRSATRVITGSRASSMTSPSS
jgi:hypothetical protein